MNKLTSLIRTKKPQVLQYDPALFADADPVIWASNLCKKNALNGLRLEAMETAFAGKNNPNTKPDKNSVIYCDPKNPKAVDNILRGISNGFAGHASLGLMHTDSLTSYNYYKPAFDFYEKTFLDKLNMTYVVGHYSHATLWFSASKHVYTAHIDLEDGFLFQFTGAKHVKVWPLPEEHLDTDIFNHSYLEKYTERTYRESISYEEFHLKAGEVLFIPAGAVHEVMTDEGLTSVSISFHMGCPYPVLTLCSELNKKYSEHHFKLSEQNSGIFKRSISLLNPKYESLLLQPENKNMPESLRDNLCQVIHSDCDNDILADILDKWWSEKLSSPTYTGPFDQVKASAYT